MEQKALIVCSFLFSKKNKRACTFNYNDGIQGKILVCVCIAYIYKRTHFKNASFVKKKFNSIYLFQQIPSTYPLFHHELFGKMPISLPLCLVLLQGHQIPNVHAFSIYIRVFCSSYKKHPLSPFFFTF